MLHLPTELVLHTLSYVPLPQIHSLRLCSRSWNVFITENESSVYHAAAILHEFADPGKTFQECKQMAGGESSWIEDTTSWKEFCRRHYMLEMRWTGQLPARHASIECLHRAVHRFKIDEQQNTVIVTYGVGGLHVASIEDDQSLWRLQYGDVRPYAHCEYGGGFLIFDRIDSELEVWRRKRDAQADPLVSSPDWLQERSNLSAYQSLPSIEEDNRGAFVPFTVLTPPSVPRAYRFMYPTLLVASQRPATVYLFDVPTGQLTQTISLALSPDTLVPIDYVELSARHIFVCTKTLGLLVYPRAADSNVPYMQFDPQQYIFRQSHLYTCDATNDTNPIGPLRPTLRECHLRQRDEGAFTGRGSSLNAVHVSSCGAHLVCAGSAGFLYIIRDFANTLMPHITNPGNITAILMGTPIVQLAYEGGRISFYAAKRGLFVIPFASQNRLSVGSLTTLSNDSSPRLYQAYTGLEGGYPPEAYCSCIQMHHTGVWYAPGISMDGRIAGRSFRRIVKPLQYVDFTQSPTKSGSGDVPEDVDKPK